MMGVQGEKVSKMIEERKKVKIPTRRRLSASCLLKFKTRIQMSIRFSRSERTKCVLTSDGKSTQGRVLLVRLDTHGLGGNKLDDGGVTRLQELGAGLHDLSGSSVDLLDELTELAGNVGGVAVEDGRVSGTDLTGVVQDDDLGVERSGLLGGVVLGVGADVSSSDVLDGNVLDVESDVVTGETLGDLLVVHLDGLDFGGHVRRSEVDDHTGLDDTGLDSTDGNCSDTTLRD
jgi:hypothetical protein